MPVSGKQLSYVAAYKAFKNLLTVVGLDPKKYSLHSLRIGGTSDAFEASVPLHVIDKQGRWKCPKTKYRYCRVKDIETVENLRPAFKY